MKKRILNLMLALCLSANFIAPFVFSANDSEEVDKYTINAEAMLEQEATEKASVTATNWVMSPSNNNAIGFVTNTFERNGQQFKVETGTRAGNVLNETHYITNLTTGKTYTYTFLSGSGTTSRLFVLEDGATTWQRMNFTSYKTYSKTESDGRQLLKRELIGSDYKATLITEVTNNGEIRQGITMENVSGGTINNVNFMASVDTMLNSNDQIPIYANGTNGTYITTEADDFTLYAEALSGVSQMYAGKWNTTTETSFQNEHGVYSTFGRTEDENLVTGVDSAIYFRTGASTLQTGDTVNFNYQSRVFDTGETIIPVNSIVIDTVDVTGNELTSQEVITQVPGTIGTITRPRVYTQASGAEYEFTQVTGTSTPPTIIGNQVKLDYTIGYTTENITFHYARVTRAGQPVTARYLDEKGATLAPSKTISGNIGDAYTFTAPQITGYTLKASPTNATGYYSNTAQIVTFIYKKIAAPITVKHINKTGNHLVEVETLTGHVGETYETAAKEIDNHVVAIIPENATGTFTEEAQEVIYVYHEEILVETGQTNMLFFGLMLTLFSTLTLAKINKKRQVN